MLTPILDPSLPADNSPLSSGEMRGRFQAIQNNFDDLRVAAFGRKPHSSAGRDWRRSAEPPLGLTVSHPPTQADAQTLADCGRRADEHFLVLR